MKAYLVIKLFPVLINKYSGVKACPLSFFFYVKALSLLLRKLQWAAFKYSSAFLVRAYSKINYIK